MRTLSQAVAEQSAEASSSKPSLRETVARKQALEEAAAHQAKRNERTAGSAPTAGRGVKAPAVSEKIPISYFFRISCFNMVPTQVL